MRELFLAYLAQHDDGAWLRAVERLEASIHPVDRNATRIWFHFFPLALAHAMARADADALARRMTLAGRWSLADQVNDSHAFLFGHRFWPVVRRVVLDFVEGPAVPGSLDLAAQVQEVARMAAAQAGTGADVTTGIAAVALRTLQQVGPDRMHAAPSTASERRPATESADSVLAARERQDRPAFWSRFRGSQRQWNVTFDERQVEARFPVIESQHITTAAALDTRDHRCRDARCTEGPIPVHCRSCSCGTCWIGVLHGAERLSPMDSRERAKLAECGVVVEGSHPVVRLACQAQSFGALSIVIPPWNGLIGRVLTPVR